MVELGEAVGVIGAQSIGEPGTQLTMRTFHIGGTASRVSEQSRLDAKNNGSVRFINLVTVRSKQGGLVAMNRSGAIAVIDERGREKERYQIVYGARLKVEEGQQVELGQVLAEWDPYTFAILTEIGGTIQFKDLQEGITLNEEVDEVTGLSRLVVSDSSDEKRQPAIIIKGSQGQQALSDAFARSPHDPGRRRGLPRRYPCQDPARNHAHQGHHRRSAPRRRALRSPQAARNRHHLGNRWCGEVRRSRKGQRKIYVTADNGEEKEYSVPRGIHVNVQEGERLKAGEPLMDGPLNPHDILAVLGEKELQGYLVNEIQEVYRLQGVTISDKHIETIVRQMLRWVKIEEVGDTSFLLEQQVDKFRFRNENERVDRRTEDVRPLAVRCCSASPRLRSRPTASSPRPSFQETTRVLTEASINGAVDNLRGLKENVIVGRLIPAGTGMEYYRNIQLSPGARRSGPARPAGSAARPSKKPNANSK